MSADDMAEFYVHTATVETFDHTDGYGKDHYAAPYVLDPADDDDGCFLDDKRSLVRDANGEQVVSETTLYTFPKHVGRFTAKSRVTIRGNVITTVIKSALHDSGDLDLPDHVAVSLQ